MKKLTLCLVIVCTLILVITGCESGSQKKKPTPPPPSSVNVSGSVVTQNGTGIDGLTVTMGSYSTQTDGNGNFTFADVDTGNYEISGNGTYDNSLYLFGPLDVNLSATVSLDPYTAYKMNGFGVISINASIIEHPDTELASIEKVNYLKNITWDDFKKRTDKGNIKNIIKVAEYNTVLAVVSDQYLKDNSSYFALKWEPVEGISQYKIMYNNQDVWDSEDSGEVFSTSDPTAYLDLETDLPNITSAGSYDFELIALDGSTETYMAEITLSIGLYLSGYPLGLDQNGNELSWDSVPEADEYSVGISDNVNFVGMSNDNIYTVDAPTTSVTYNSSNLTEEYYYFKVDARYYGESEYPLEIARNISGFKTE